MKKPNLKEIYSNFRMNADKALIAGSICAMSCIGAFAAEGDTSAASTNTALGIITETTASLKSDAVTVIGAGLGIGVLFFGAKFLWGKFKSMTK